MSYTLSEPPQTSGQICFRRHGFQLRSRRLPFSHGPFIHSAVVFDVLMHKFLIFSDSTLASMRDTRSCVLEPSAKTDDPITAKTTKGLT